MCSIDYYQLNYKLNKSN